MLQFRQFIDSQRHEGLRFCIRFGPQMWIGTDPQRERATRAAPTAASARNPSRAAPSASTSPTSRPASGATPHRTPSTATSADAKPPKAPRRNPYEKGPLRRAFFDHRISASCPKSGMCSPSAVGLQSFKVSTLLRYAQSASLRHLTEKPKRGSKSLRRMAGLL